MKFLFKGKIFWKNFGGGIFWQKISGRGVLKTATNPL